jgi:rfaE bifunctional protein nucleotidyltransferase chain/domain
MTNPDRSLRVSDPMSTDKLCGVSALKRQLVALHRQGKRIVFTNGCFDLIHPGHVRYLRAAKRLGDVLVVGLNSDASVRRLKGPGRPLVPQRDRCEVMAALEMVDFVTVFDEDTPYELIRRVQPDVLVKGGDWTPDKIVGADLVRARGGAVRSLRFAKGYSTTRLVEGIRSKVQGPKSNVQSRKS